MRRQFMLWRGYTVKWCERCETPTIVCKDEACRGASCNGGGCDKCGQDFTDFLEKWQTDQAFFLTVKENTVE